ncbi:MAG: hypothetical protein ACTSRU_02195, partial [Candidatus Hodarchaeales archaeon]
MIIDTLKNKKPSGESDMNQRDILFQLTRKIQHELKLNNHQCEKFYEIMKELLCVIEVQNLTSRKYENDPEFKKYMKQERAAMITKELLKIEALIESEEP